MIKLVNLLNEVGEAGVSYSIEKITGAGKDVGYLFTTKDGDDYVVRLEYLNLRTPGVYSLSFYPGSSISPEEERRNVSLITNKGDTFRIMSTVVNALKDFIATEEGVQEIRWTGTQTGDKPEAAEQRNKLYNAYVKKALSNTPDWELVSGGVFTALKKKKQQ